VGGIRVADLGVVPVVQLFPLKIALPGEVDQAQLAAHAAGATSRTMSELIPANWRDKESLVFKVMLFF